MGAGRSGKITVTFNSNGGNETLAAKEVTTIDDIKYIERGYEDFHLKLQGLGAQIELIDNEREFRKFKLKIG